MWKKEDIEEAMVGARSLAEVGERLGGLTRERARQLINKHGLQDKRAWVYERAERNAPRMKWPRMGTGGINDYDFKRSVWECVINGCHVSINTTGPGRSST